MAGQILDATLVAAPRQRNTETERARIKAGESADRSDENERYLATLGKVRRIRRRKPPGRPRSRRTTRANAAKSAVRAHVEHPLAHRKGPMWLGIRTVGLARAAASVTLANMADNMKRWCRLDQRSAPA